MIPRLAAAFGVLVSLISPLPGSASSCTPDAWFLGIVHDDSLREDFVLDVDNFEFFLGELRQTHCIPDANAEILAFANNYSRNGKTYAPATEQNLRARLATFGAAASTHPGSTFFFMLSTHGNAYENRLCNGVRRVVGSFAALKSEGGEGTLYDCELGASLSGSFSSAVRMLVAVDCSFCGGFSDSLTAASGTVPDGRALVSSGIPAANRVVITGCAVTTECFGGPNGGRSYGHFKRTMAVSQCDGFTAPGFPAVQGLNLPQRSLLPDGGCTSSEWFFAAVNSAYTSVDAISIQQQFRIKYGFDDLATDIPIV